MSDEQLTVETNEWATTAHANAYLERAHLMPRRDTGYDELDLETQLGWLGEIGFVEVDCFWKWRELALLSGVKP